jgi:hypothetical protein
MKSPPSTPCRPLGPIGLPETRVTRPGAPVPPPSRPRAGFPTRSKLHSIARVTASLSDTLHGIADSRIERYLDQRVHDLASKLSRQQRAITGDRVHLSAVHKRAPDVVQGGPRSEQEIIPLRDEQGAYLFLIGIKSELQSHQISRGRRRRIQENFAEQADCWSGISRICRKIDSRVNVRIDTQPPGYGSEPHLDFIVTDLDGMLARLCGPDRKIIRLRDKRGIYLFLIEITAITKYLAAPTADPGEFARPDCWSGISEICWNIDSQVLRADRRSRRPGLGGARLRRPLRRFARSDRVAGAAGTRHDLNCVPPYIEIPLLEIEFGVAILRRWQFIPYRC